jgi:peptidoglycan/xylan/chitin deacetylase (PgdA/CDA1 family)
VLERLGGEKIRFFRPPEGVCTEAVKSYCEQNGMTIVLWSVDTRDWAHTPVGEICENVRKNAKNGSIILMHDFIGKNSPTPAALRRIIPMLQELGYEFVTVSQLLGEAE